MKIDEFYTIIITKFDIIIEFYLNLILMISILIKMFLLILIKKLIIFNFLLKFKIISFNDVNYNNSSKITKIFQNLL